MVMPWCLDNSETTQISEVREYQYLPNEHKKVFEPMFVLESEIFKS